MTVLCLEYGTLKRHFSRLSEIPLSLTYVATGDMPAGETVADLGVEDELVIFASKKALTFRRKGVQCKVSIMVTEPLVVQRGLYRLLPYFTKRFHRVLTHSNILLEACANSEKWAYGGTWVGDVAPSAAGKTGRVSIIASKKRSAEGHVLRHALIEHCRGTGVDLDVFGRGYDPLDNKADGHLPYCFSVVIENSRSAGYFTEKLVDALVCESVPIYWGDPEIAQYFDTRGMILCETLQELERAVADASFEDFQNRRAYVEKNRALALETMKMERSMTRLSGT